MEGSVRVFLHKVTVLDEIQRNSIRFVLYFHLLHSTKDITSVAYIWTNLIIQGVLTKKLQVHKVSKEIKNRERHSIVKLKMAPL